jgi:hypothetical protein
MARHRHIDSDANGLAGSRCQRANFSKQYPWQGEIIVAKWALSEDKIPLTIDWRVGIHLPRSLPGHRIVYASEE